MNELLEYYKDKNRVQSWADMYSSASRARVMYWFKSTNLRTLQTFVGTFTKFGEVENIPRSRWPTDSRGQEVHKQHVLSIIRSGLYSEESPGVFVKTAKGRLFADFIDNYQGTDDEKWLIIYMFLLDGVFDETKNYIVTRTNDLNENLKNNGVHNFTELAESMVRDSSQNIYQSGFFLVSSFYDENEFLQLYSQSNAADKSELSRYIESNLNLHSYSVDTLAKKYQTSGNYSRPMLLDDAKLVYVTSKVIAAQYSGYEDYIRWLVGVYSKYIEINQDRVIGYLLQDRTREVLEVVFQNLYDVGDAEIIEDELDEPELETAPEENVAERTGQDAPENKIDVTTVRGKRQNNKVFARRKPIVRQIANFQCELDSLNNCRYFTSASTGQNYIEVHHLIPQEFRNDFVYSIEVFANYIPLCAHCHRMIHLAVSRERESMVNYLHSRRSVRLASAGLEIQLSDLKDYYKIRSN